MHSPRQLIAGILIGAAVLAAIAGTTYDSGLGRFYGDTVLTSLQTGSIYFDTASNTFWVGNVTSNPVKVGDAALATTNYVHDQGFVTASVTNGLADTNFVKSAVSNRPVSNAWNTLTWAITNSPPAGTNLVLWTEDGTNLYWRAYP